MSANPSALPPQIESTLVLHVKSFTDRQRHMQRELGRLGIPFEFVTEFDIPEISPAIEAQYFLPGCMLSPAEKSCCLKHLAALRRVAELPDDRFAIVLEDDVFLTDNFLEILAKAVEEAMTFPSPRVVQLGCGFHMYVPKGRLQPGKYLYRATEVRAADSYLIDPESARRRIAHIESHPMAVPADHLFNHIDVACGIPFYWLEPTIVEQGSMNGKFRSAISDKRSRRSLASQYLHYHVTKLRTAVLDPIFRRNKKV